MQANAPSLYYSLLSTVEVTASATLDKRAKRPTVEARYIKKLNLSIIVVKLSPTKIKEKQKTKG